MSAGSISRRRLLAGGALAAIAAPAISQSRNITLVCPAPPGGSLDFVTRLVGSHLARQTGDTVVVENRSGASTNIGTEFVAHSAPDGRTVLFAGVSMAINGMLFKLNFDPLRDLRPVVQLSHDYSVLAVPADSPIKGPADLVRLAESRRGGLNCGAPPGHMFLACRQLGAIMPAETIPYPGVGPAVNALLSGTVDAVFAAPEAAVRPFVDSGKIRIVAVADALREMPALAQVAGFRQLWPGLVTTGFLGAWVPAATATQTVITLNQHLNRVLAEPEVRERLLSAGEPVAGGTPEAFMAVAQRAHDEYQKVITRLGVRPE